MGRRQRERARRKTAVKSSASAANVEGLSDSLSNLYRELNLRGWNNTTFLKVSYFGNTGRGLCSKTQEFHTGDELIRLPLQCLITTRDLESNNAFQQVFDTTKFTEDQRVSFQALLAVYLLYEKHLVNRASESKTEKGDFMKAYLSSLPKAFSTPYFCRINELQYLPEAVLESAAAQNRSILRSYSNFKEVISVDLCSCCGQSLFEDILTLPEFKWSYFVVNTRSVYINNRRISKKEFFFKNLIFDEPNLALAPLLDMFNHTDSVETRADLLSSSNASECDNDATRQLQYDYVLRMLHHPQNGIKRFEQIFISYGQLPNKRLFSEFGFVISDNIHDYFEISLHDIENFIRSSEVYKNLHMHRNKFKFIRDHNLDDQMFVIAIEPHSAKCKDSQTVRDNGISHNLRVVLHLLLKERTHFLNVLSRIAFGDEENLEPMQSEVMQLISFKIKEYQNFLVSLSTQNDLSSSASMAVTYLKECIHYLEKYLSECDLEERVSRID